MNTHGPTAATPSAAAENSCAEGASNDANWQQLEDFARHLHDAARSASGPVQFYQPLLQEAVALLAAMGGAVWQISPRGQPELLCQTNLNAVLASGDEEGQTAHRKLLQAAVESNAPALYPPQSSSDSTGRNPTSAVVLLHPVVTRAVDADAEDRVQTVVELFQRPGSSPAVQQGWQEVLAAACLAAADFHHFHELRSLRGEQRDRGQSADLLLRIGEPIELKQVAMEVVNEGRRFTGCDRVSLLVQKGRQWHLLATSGTDRTETRADVSRRLCELADRAANWAQPVCYDEKATDETDDLPDALSEILARHIDESHARQLTAVSIQFNPTPATDSPRPGRFSNPEPVPRSPSPPKAVLIAETFSTDPTERLAERTTELAELCRPALRRAWQLDPLPVRAGLQIARGAAWLGTTLGLRRAAWALAGVIAVVAALVLVPYDYEVSAPARLVPRIERNVFATCDGTVAELHAAHGDEVARGEVLAVLHDPQLAIASQKVHGEIQTVLKQIEAVSAARTERTVREEVAKGSLPFSAEQQQLNERLVGLRAQQRILDRRREALTLRSPIAGQVLTLDVENLLKTRPVARGEVLLTVADLESGWLLEVDLPQDRLGAVLQAQKTAQPDLPVRFRLAGNLSETCDGHVEQISSRAVTTTDDLNADAPPIRVTVAVDEQELPTGRPGMTAEVRIACGRRSVGYVWLHDLWETVYHWFAF